MITTNMHCHMQKETECTKDASSHNKRTIRLLKFFKTNPTPLTRSNDTTSLVLNKLKKLLKLLYK